MPNLLPESLQWIWSQSGLLVPFPTPQHAPCETLGSKKSPPELPEEKLLRNFLDVYICSPTRRIFPVIDPALFDQTIKVAYLDDGTSYTQNQSAKACILTFMAMVSYLYHFDPSYHGAELPPIPRDAYIAHATALLPDLLQEPLDLDALQTIILIVGFSCSALTYRSSLCISDDSRSFSRQPSVSWLVRFKKQLTIRLLLPVY